MARTTPRVDGDILVLTSHDESPITVGTPAWFDWLQSANTFAFTSPFGSFTARKEARSRGGSYWKAYSTAHGTLHRTYLGKASDLTLDRLNDAATRLAAAATPWILQPMRPSATRRPTGCRSPCWPPSSMSHWHVLS